MRVPRPTLVGSYSRQAGGRVRNAIPQSRDRSPAFVFLKLSGTLGPRNPMPKRQKPPLRILPDIGDIGIQPTRTLDQHGRKLWDQVTSEYDIDDIVGREMLTLACQALDRAEGLSQCIAKDGEMVKAREGIKAHPAIREELACRAFIIKTLRHLGLSFEPVRASVGRPAKGFGWTGA